MRPQRPYLLRALYDWIVDSDEVPYVLVDANVPGVEVPQDYVENGQIVLNVGPSATRDLHISDSHLMCNSRFNGRAFELVLPMASIRAIYCKDSGEGMVFPEETLGEANTPPTTEVGADTTSAPSGEAPAGEDAAGETRAGDKKPTHLKLV